MKKISRRQQRIWTMQAIFEMDFRKIDSSEAILNLEERELDSKYATYTHKLISLVNDNLLEIDGMIEKFARQWRIERMPKVDLSILRMTIAEMLYVDEVSDNIAINEAIELAKKFGTEKSGKFINGVLGAFSNFLDKRRSEKE